MKPLFLICGLISVAFGAVGAVLPILPTAPFLLAAAFCFAKSSTRLDRWLRSTRLYKNNLESLARGKGMTRRAKLRVMSAITLTLLIAFFAMHRVPIGRIVLAAVWIAHVFAFTFVIKTCSDTLPEEEITPNDQQTSAPHGSGE